MEIFGVIKVCPNCLDFVVKKMKWCVVLSEEYETCKEDGGIMNPVPITDSLLSLLRDSKFLTELESKPKYTKLQLVKYSIEDWFSHTKFLFHRHISAPYYNIILSSGHYCRNRFERWVNQKLQKPIFRKTICKLYGYKYP